MATTVYTFYVRADAGTGATSLTPTWSGLNYVSTGAAVATASRPAITEIGYGWYKVSWDAVTNGAVAGQIDAGATITGDDRYVLICLDIPAGERADLAVQLLHNSRSGPSAGAGTETVSNRAGDAAIATYTRTNNGTTQSRVPTASL